VKGEAAAEFNAMFSDRQQRQDLKVFLRFDD